MLFRRVRFSRLVLSAPRNESDWYPFYMITHREEMESKKTSLKEDDENENLNAPVIVILIDSCQVLLEIIH